MGIEANNVKSEYLNFAKIRLKTIINQNIPFIQFFTIYYILEQ